MSSPALIDVPHIFQDENWDCGLACAKMVLRCLRIPIEQDGFDVACQKVGINQTVWTINLAHLMSHFGIEHEFFTITLGVDPTYKEVDFYNSNHFVFSEEEIKINELFKAAADKGIVVTKRSLDIREIISQLEKGCLAIVLIDSSIIDCLVCNSNQSKNSPNCFPIECLGDPVESEALEERGYIGHFIVVCGYDLQKKLIFYKNPGIMVDLCQCSFDNFDAARKSHGTDEDILFVHI